jgi:CRP/FNR family cyclic AMP-dependent transcriptional regulator
VGSGRAQTLAALLLELPGAGPQWLIRSYDRDGMAEVMDTLRDVPLFAGLSDKELKRVADNMVERTFSDGQEITSQDARGNWFFVIEEGTASVSKNGETVRNLGPGDYFGEIALIDRGARSATIIANGELRCQGLSAIAFRPLVQTHPEIAWPLLEALVERLRDAETRAGGELR